MTREVFNNGDRVVFGMGILPHYNRVELYKRDRSISIHHNGVCSVEDAIQFRDAFNAAIEEASK